MAAFDFDGTITQRDTLMGFLVAVGGVRRVATTLVANGADLVRGRTDGEARDRAKDAVVGAALAGRTDDELQRAGRTYAEKLPARFRPDTVAHIERHRSQGHRTVIVSASLVYYLEPVAERLGIDKVLGVAVEFDADGRCTGRLAGDNVRGAQKERLLTGWLGSNGPTPELWCYGNSAGDDELLAMADHPVWIGRRAERNPTP